MKKKVLSIGATVVASLMLLTACAGGADDNSSSEETGGVLNAKASIAVFNSGPASAMEWMAFDKGFTEEYGVTLDKTFGVVTGKEITASLINGSAQFGSVTTMTAQPLMESGECFTFLTAGQRNIYELIANPDLGLDDYGSFPENLKGLKGKKVGVSANGTLGESLAQYVLEQGGLEEGDVTFVATGGVASAIAAFREGQVDATWSFAPQLQIYEENEYVKLTDFLSGTDDPVIGEYIQHLLATTCDYAEKNPEIIQAVCMAVWDAYDYAADPANAKEMASFFVDKLALEPEIADGYWEQYKGSYKSPTIMKENWDALSLIGLVQPDYDETVNASCAVTDPRA